MARKLLFIVNPNAGKKISDKLIETINNEFPKDVYYQIVIWKDKNHFKEVLDILHSQDYTDVIAVGGDGTVNQVASSLINTSITFGIVPAGSGNGLARSLKLSMNVSEVIKQIAAGKTEVVDYGIVNERPFFCTSGIGFDAHIGNLFATSVKRGLQSYVKITVRELLKYKGKNYTITLNGETIKRKAFLITIANAGQYGNEFYIAPQANLQDGQFHVVILRPTGVFGAISLFNKILTKKAHQSKYIETFVTNELSIVESGNTTIHYDGEPAEMIGTLTYKCQNHKLKVIVGNGFKPSLIP